jgi:hypothetical protein
MVEVKDAGHDIHHSHPDWLIANILDWAKGAGDEVMLPRP